MRDGETAAAPFEIKAALLLIYALLFARVTWVLLVVRGEMLAPRSGLPPLLVPLVIAFVIATRRGIRRGRRWARSAYVAYALGRVILVAVRGRFDSVSISFALGYLLIAMLLLGPSTRAWFHR